MRFAISVPAC